MLVAVLGYRRPGLELDQVQHRAFAEQRPSADAFRQLERADIVEVHELRRRHWLIILGSVPAREEIRVTGQPEPISHHTDTVSVGDL
jgi:hypothetical protein